MRLTPPPSRKQAEKLFRKKASPDSKLSPREFLKKKLKRTKPVKVTREANKTTAPGELYNAQRAKYEKSMNRAMKKGGSNGVGVGY